MTENKAEAYRLIYDVADYAWVTHDNGDGTYDVSPPKRLLLAGSKEQIQKAIDDFKKMTRVPSGEEWTFTKLSHYTSTYCSWLWLMNKQSTTDRLAQDRKSVV